MPKKSKWQEFKNLFQRGRSISWYWRNAVNLVDDGPDGIKHKIHGAKIFGIRIRLPKWLMRGSGDPTK